MGAVNRGSWVRGRCLGRGATAGVYLAASVSDGTQSLFAVKSAELSKSGPVQREQHILSSLCSPHVVACFGSDVTTEPDGRVLFNLFLEYVPGADLSAVVRRHGGLDEHAVREYARGILHGLAYLHGRGIVHCDVKGQNILVREDDMAVKLADLGCAKRVDCGGGGEGGGIIGGTPLYMAPEVARGEEQAPAADIWALGCTVIEMATGRSPWGADVHDPAAAIHRIAFSDDVPDLPCNISDDAKDFLGRCLSRDPRKRWSAEELLNHSFVKFSEQLQPEKIKRSSPKSTLDQVFWDSWPEEDGEEDVAGELFESQGVEYYSGARERLRQLFAGGASWANPTTWEESSWITIRNNETLRNARWEQRDEPSTSAGGPWSVSRRLSLVTVVLVAVLWFPWPATCSPSCRLFFPSQYLWMALRVINIHLVV